MYDVNESFRNIGDRLLAEIDVLFYWVILFELSWFVHTFISLVNIDLACSSTPISTK